MTDSPPATRPPRSILAGVFLISACTLALEVALTRVFSAVLRYHFVFLVISVAVCGLGIGGMLAHGAGRWRRLTLPTASCGFGLSALVLTYALFKLILPYRPDWLGLIALLVLGPFVFAGMFLAIAFRSYAQWSGHLYAWDLCGAALASLGVVAGLQVFGAVNACLLIALLSLAVAFVESHYRVLVTAALLAPAASLLFNLTGKWLDIPPLPVRSADYAKPLYVELADRSVGSKIVYTEWDAFARTDVVEDPQAGKDVLLVYTNGHVPTMIVRHDSRSGRYALTPMIAEVPFFWLRPNSVLCIGPGGGLDILLAKQAGAKRIDGVEINPAIPRILRRPRFRAFGGNPYGLQGVHVVVGDGRTFVMRSRRTYDLIFTALTKTSTSSVGLSLVEGYIYTVDAFEDYWSHLSAHGALVLVTDHYATNLRLFTTALAALARRGMKLSEALDHVALISVPARLMGQTPYEFALMVSRKPMIGRQADVLSRMTRAGGYQAVFIPGNSEAWPFTKLRDEGATLDQFAYSADQWLQSALPENLQQPLNLMPVTDDSPFFLDLSWGIPSMLLPLLFGTIALVIAFSAFATVRRIVSFGDWRPAKAAAGAVSYFSCLGIGFMMVEIPLIQKLILVLGHPTLALTVVLFALLLGGGIGSALSQRVASASLSERTRLACISVALLTVGLSFYLGARHALILALPLPGRIIWAGGISGALGVLMGMPFPLGVRALAQSRPEDIPWMWGVNGVTSVLGSTLAAVGGKLVGFQMVFAGGAALYLAAALLGPALLSLNTLPPPTHNTDT